MPPKKKPNEKSNEKSNEKCELCLGDIKANEDALVCSGKCQATLHRYCAGVTVSHYKKILAPDTADKFTCLQCSQQESAAKIESLEHALAQALAALSTQHPAPSTSQQNSSHSLSSPENCDYARATSEPSVLAASSSNYPPRPKHNPQATTLTSERKFNIVVYGINECPKGTRMHKRLSDDINSVSEIVHSICPDLSNQSICDCTRLGKYSEERSRPIVARLFRVQDVHAILANRQKLSNSPNNKVSIKPFMSKSDRLTESTLLKERRALIDSGFDRSIIKIRGNSLYVKNKKFGTAKELKFTPHSTTTSTIGQTPDNHFETQPVSDSISQLQQS